MRRPTLFVTGMQRSGTTLLEKVLSSHPSVSLLSQPFPFLFLEVKRAFFRSRGVQPPGVPLSPLFRDVSYSCEDLQRFLARHVVSRRALEEVFDAMEAFSGQYTKFEEERLRAAFRRFRPGNLASCLAQLHRLLAHDPDAPWCGAKETLCEEFLPFLIARSLRAVVILRDPRDVLASLNHGSGERFAGLPKPTLFNLRNWRKSVAYALHLEDHPGFLWLRYEDLVARTATTLERLAHFLGIEPFDNDAFGDGILGAQGETWSGNSSHRELRGISREPVGRFRDLLPPEVQRLVEAVCRPELQRLGYGLDFPDLDAQAVLEAFEEPYPMSRSELARHLPSPRNVRDELARLRLLGEDGNPRKLREFFMFEDIPIRLRCESPQ